MLVFLSILAIVLVVILAGLIYENNKIKELSNQINEAFSTMDIYLKQRHDLIPNLIEVVKGYSDYEEKTLNTIAANSLNAAKTNNISELAKNEKELDKASNTIIALSQAYPELKSDRNYRQLMQQLQKTEEDIANARKYYNASVREYNNKISSFPGSFIAKGAKSKPYFQVDSQEDRDSVKVDF